MNSYGGKTGVSLNVGRYGFESSVNSYGGKTQPCVIIIRPRFESSVNSYGGKTHNVSGRGCRSLRVV